MENYESITSGRWNAYRHPIYSSTVMLAISVLVMLVAKTNHPTLPWQVCGVSILFFAIYNQVVGLFLRRWRLYMGLSYLVFIAYVVLLLLAASAIADTPLATLPTFKKTYTLLVVFFIMLTVLSGVYRVALYMIGTTRRP